MDFKNIKKIIQQTAKDELEHFKSSASTQITGKDQSVSQGNSDKPNPIVEAMQQASEKGEDPEKAAEKAKALRQMPLRTKKIEDEIEYWGRKRDELKKAWDEKQNELMKSDDVVVNPGAPILPSTGRPKRGSAGAVGGGGSSPETRKAKH